MISLPLCAIFWTLLFSDGGTAPTCTDPGLVDAKPAGMDSYVSGDASEVKYEFYPGTPYAVQGYWTSSNPYKE